jgi:hypothetical protein
VTSRATTAPSVRASFPWRRWCVALALLGCEPPRASVDAAAASADDGSLPSAADVATDVPREDARPDAGFVDAPPAPPFVVDDQIVQPMDLNVIDSEIAERDSLLAWQSRENRLKVTPIDPVTGAIAWEQTQDLDAILPFGETGNGPEIGLGTRFGTSIVYHRLSAGVSAIAHAWRGADGRWNTQVLSPPLAGIVPFASQVAGWSAPVVAFRSPMREGQPIVRAWADLERPDRSGVFPQVEGRGPNLAVPLRGDGAERRRLILLDYRVGSWNQLFTFDVDRSDLTQVTSDERFKTRGAILFNAPDAGGRLMVLAATTEQADRTRGDRASLYALTASGWQRGADLRPPSELPYLHSAEPFSFAGRTYLSYFMTDGLNFGEATRAEMWISSMDGSFHRKVSSPAFENSGREIFDPETFATTDTVWLYYTEVYPPNTRVTHRAATGLRP